MFADNATFIKSVKKEKIKKKRRRIRGYIKISENNIRTIIIKKVENRDT